MFNPVESREINGGRQDIYRFDNGYGASVVNHLYSYGIEMGVVKFNSESNLDFELVYDTPITDDVLGYLSEDGVESYLKDIEAL